MTYTYKTKGTCSTQIVVSIENGVVTGLEIERGCDGNTQGLSRLAVGMNADEVVRRCKGIQCGSRGTSCPDQVARAIEAALKEDPSQAS